MFIITAEEAKKHIEPPKLSALTIQPEYAVHQLRHLGPLPRERHGPRPLPGGQAVECLLVVKEREAVAALAGDVPAASEGLDAWRGGHGLVQRPAVAVDPRGAAAIRGQLGPQDRRLDVCWVCSWWLRARRRSWG